MQRVFERGSKKDSALVQQSPGSRAGSCSQCLSSPHLPPGGTAVTYMLEPAAALAGQLQGTPNGCCKPGQHSDSAAGPQYCCLGADRSQAGAHQSVLARQCQRRQ